MTQVRLSFSLGLLSPSYSQQLWLQGNHNNDLTYSLLATSGWEQSSALPYAQQCSSKFWRIPINYWNLVEQIPSTYNFEPGDKVNMTAIQIAGVSQLINVSIPSKSYQDRRERKPTHHDFFHKSAEWHPCRSPSQSTTYGWSADTKGTYKSSGLRTFPGAPIHCLTNSIAERCACFSPSEGTHIQTGSV